MCMDLVLEREQSSLFQSFFLFFFFLSLRKSSDFGRLRKKEKKKRKKHTKKLKTEIMMIARVLKQILIHSHSDVTVMSQ